MLPPPRKAGGGHVSQPLAKDDNRSGQADTPRDVAVLLAHPPASVEMEVSLHQVNASILAHESSMGLHIFR